MSTSPSLERPHLPLPLSLSNHSASQKFNIFKFHFQLEVSTLAIEKRICFIIFIIIQTSMINRELGILPENGWSMISARNCCPTKLR